MTATVTAPSNAAPTGPPSPVDRMTRWDWDRLEQAQAARRRQKPPTEPPKQRCSDRAVHDKHLIEGVKDKLMWTCPGRNGSRH